MIGRMQNLSVSYLPASQWPSESDYALGTWLTEAEQSELSALEHAQRRREWLAGRWTGKQLLAHVTGHYRLLELQILTRGADALGSAHRSA